jgi:hypothetical protein
MISEYGALGGKRTGRYSEKVRPKKFGRKG